MVTTEKNEKSCDAVRQTLDDQCDTPRRSTSPLRCRLFSEENSSIIFLLRIPQSKNDSAFSNGDNSSDGSMILNNPNSSSAIKQKFGILQGKFCIPRGVIFDECETLTKDKIWKKIQHNMVHTLNFPCSLKFYGAIRRNINSLITYAKCRYTSHVQQFCVR
ncbi:hypothetical protein PV325_005094 [Microctonus aethiopoides]|nr:hypothetical protein PV325_005094 [Microctonus aethiopoides]